MPSMYVNVPRLEQETKTPWWPSSMTPPPRSEGPHIYTFVNEYETLYENGQPPPRRWWWPTSRPAPSRRRRSMPSPRACARRCGRFWERTKDLTLVFHDNGLDRIAIGGVTIATKMKK